MGGDGTIEDVWEVQSRVNNEGAPSKETGGTDPVQGDDKREFRGTWTENITMVKFKHTEDLTGREGNLTFEVYSRP